MAHKRNHTTYKHKSQKTMKEMHERNTTQTKEYVNVTSGHCDIELKVMSCLSVMVCLVTIFLRMD